MSGSKDHGALNPLRFTNALGKVQIWLLIWTIFVSAKLFSIGVTHILNKTKLYMFGSHSQNERPPIILSFTNDIFLALTYKLGTIAKLLS